MRQKLPVIINTQASSIWLQFTRITGYYQLQQADTTRIIKNQRIISMLKRSLNSFNIVRRLSNVDRRVLRVLHAQSKPGPFVPTLPAATLLREVALAYADADVFIVEKSAIQLKKVNQMFA